MTEEIRDAVGSRCSNVSRRYGNWQFEHLYDDNRYAVVYRSQDFTGRHATLIDRGFWIGQGIGRPNNRFNWKNFWFANYGEFVDALTESWIMGWVPWFVEIPGWRIGADDVQT